MWQILLRNLKDVLHEEESDSRRKVWDAKRNDKEIGKHIKIKIQCLGHTSHISTHMWIMTTILDNTNMAHFHHQSSLGQHCCRIMGGKYTKIVSGVHRL